MHPSVLLGPDLGVAFHPCIHAAAESAITCAMLVALFD